MHVDHYIVSSQNIYVILYLLRDLTGYLKLFSLIDPQLSLTVVNFVSLIKH